MHLDETNRLLITAIGGALLVALIALVLFTPFYQTNDDVAMRLLAEGNFVPESGPLPFLMFTNIVVGALLRVLYGLAPSLPWYDLVLGASMAAATAGFLCIWLGSRKWYELAWSIVFAVFFLLPGFVNVQFSIAGLGCAGAGIALLVRAAVAPLDERLFRWHVLFGAILVLLGSMVRAEGAALMLLEGGVLALPFAIGAFRDVTLRPRWKRTLVAGVAAVALAVVAFGANHLAYERARGWQEFYQYNFARARIAEYLTADRITPEHVARLTKQVGWTHNDFLLFRNWFFTDPNLYSFARVQQAERLLFSAAGRPKEAAPAPLPLLRDSAKQYFTQLRPALLVLALFAIAWRGRLRLILYLSFAILTFAGLIALMTVVAKAPPERILWPMVMFVAAMLPLAAQRWGQAAHPAIITIALLGSAYVAAPTLLDLQRKNVERRAASAEALRDVEALRQTGATFFVLHANAFPYEDFWRPLRTEKAPFPFVGLGVSARTPPVQEFLKRTGRTDLPLSLCTEPHSLLIARTDLPPLLTQFAIDHHDRQVRYTPVFEGKRITAWKCDPASP
jgi:hypothetical protein